MTKLFKSPLTLGYVTPNAFNPEFPFSYPTQESMVPAFSIKLLELKTGVPQGHALTASERNHRGTGRYGKYGNSTDLRNYLGVRGGFYYRNLYNIFSDNNGIKVNSLKILDKVLDKMESKTNDYLADNTIQFKYLTQEISDRGLNLLWEYTKYNAWSKIHVGSNYYLTNYHCVLARKEGVNTEVKPIFCLMVHREYVEYYKLCHLLGRDPDPRIFELWINPEFDVTKSEWTSLRSSYRKNYKIDLETTGVKIVEVEDILPRIFNLVETPQFSTISDTRKFKTEASAEFLEAVKVEASLKDKGINLTI